MSFNILRDIFIGRYGADSCVRAVLFLKSPTNVKNYLTRIHKVIFSSEDIVKNERWDAYPKVSGVPDVIPIREKDLSDSNFMSEQADQLSFDISRSLEFLNGYTKVDDDIKPVMLHYGMIYLFDFFSRTWLKYGRNWGHGIRLVPDKNDYCVEISKSGIFPRAVDAFYFTDQSSLFSVDDNLGIKRYATDQSIDQSIAGKLIIKLEKMKYSESPRICLNHLFEVHEKLIEKRGYTEKSNLILVGYVILFIISSISRYRPKDWFKTALGFSIGSSAINLSRNVGV